MSYRMQLSRFNSAHQPVHFNSREHGYLVLTLYQIQTVVSSRSPDEAGWIESNEVPESEGNASTGDSADESVGIKTGFSVNPIKIRFIPDPKLSVNQIIEFKHLASDMRMILSQQSDGGLKIVYHNGHLSFVLSHYTSEIEVRIPEPDIAQIQTILDQLCIVVSTNTFFRLDLVEIKNSTKKNFQEVTNYLWSVWR